MQGEFSGEHRAADGGDGAVDEGFRPGQADAFDGVDGERTRDEVVEIFRGMDTFELVTAGTGGLMKLLVGDVAVLAEMAIDHAELRHGEAVAVGQGANVVGVVDERQVGGVWGRLGCSGGGCGGGGCRHGES